MPGQHSHPRTHLSPLATPRASQLDWAEFKEALDKLSIRLPVHKMRELFESLDDDHQGAVSYDELCKALFPTQDWDRLHQLQSAAIFVQARARGFLIRKRQGDQSFKAPATPSLGGAAQKGVGAAATDAISPGGESVVKSAKRVARSARRAGRNSADAPAADDGRRDRSDSGESSAPGGVGSTLSSMLRKTPSASKLTRSPSASKLTKSPSAAKLVKSPSASKFGLPASSNSATSNEKKTTPAVSWDEAHEERLVALEKMMVRCCGIAELLLADTLRREGQGPEALNEVQLAL